VTVLSDQEYLATSQTLNRLAGLVFDDSRRAALSAIVTERMAAAGSASVEGYLHLVESPVGAPERQRLLDAVTIQETHFFRNLPQVEALRRDILPALIGDALAARRPVTVWSAGCSTGEEPYTLAMLLLEAMHGRGPVPVRILGTDVSAAALEVADAGVYAGRTIQLAEAGAADRWFDAGSDGSWRVKDEVRELVDFQVHNLVTEPPPFAYGEVDLLVCRNVTIYFSRETTQSLMHRFHEVMRDGAYLVLGHAETLWQVSDAFALVPVGDAFVYRRDRVAGSGAPARPPRAGSPSHRSSRPEPRRGPLGRLRPPVRIIRQRGSAPEPAVPPVEPLEQAREALAAGRYDEAASLAADASAGEPLSAEAYVVQARAFGNLGRDDEALEALRKAVFLDPAAGHAHFLLASTLTKLGNREAASLSFAAAAETLPLATPGALADLLDGRAVDDLVDLCRKLASATRPTNEPIPTTPAGRRPR